MNQQTNGSPRNKRTQGAGAAIRAGRIGVLLVASAAVLIQFIPAPARTNPTVRPGHGIQATLAVPAEVAAMLRRSCGDCHSNETRWPWYSRLAPLSWYIAGDVQRAREALNFSEWATASGKSPELAVSALATACADVEIGRMPLPGYLRMHPEAKVSAREREELCAWTTAQSERILARRGASISEPIVR